MEEYNKQYGYRSQPIKTNIYLDKISFDEPKNAHAKQFQYKYLFNRFAYMASATDMMGPNSRLLLYIRERLITYPEKYGITWRDFGNAYCDILSMLSEISKKYVDTGIVDERLFQNGFLILNENFYHDVTKSPKKFLIKSCANAFLMMQDNFKQILKNDNERAR